MAGAPADTDTQAKSYVEEKRKRKRSSAGRLGNDFNLDPGIQHLLLQSPYFVPYRVQAVDVKALGAAHEILVALRIRLLLLVIQHRVARNVHWIARNVVATVSQSMDFDYERTRQMNCTCT